MKSAISPTHYIASLYPTKPVTAPIQEVNLDINLRENNPTTITNYSYNKHNAINPLLLH